jgi:pyruvate kinase
MTNKQVHRKIKLPSHKTKIVCTIGPASRSPKVLEELLKNGMNVARLNFSFGTSIEHRKDIRQIKKIAAELHSLHKIFMGQTRSFQ